MNDTSLRLAWLTDAHMSSPAYSGQAGLPYGDFVRLAVRDRIDAVLAEGTLAEISRLVASSEQLRDESDPCPLLFTVREPGFAHKSIADFQQPIKRLCSRSQYLHYLGADDEPLPISKSLALVGHDGWADSRYGLDDPSVHDDTDGDTLGSTSRPDQFLARSKLDGLADEAVDRLIRVLCKAVKHFPRVVLLTAVPPWLELCSFGERLRQYPYAPIYSSATAGFAIEQVMKQAPHCKLVVLSGRQGAFAKCRPLPNILAFSGDERRSPDEVCSILRLAA